MITTILEEINNGYLVTVYGTKNDGKFQYERFVDAKAYRDMVELQYINKDIRDKVGALGVVL
jgi:hypothetical protein